MHGVALDSEKGYMHMYKEYRFDGSERFDIRSASTSETKLCADRKKAEEKMQKNMRSVLPSPNT